MTAMRAATRHEPPLSPTSVEILTWVAQHRLLATSQVAALREPDASTRWTRALLSDLERRGLLAAVRAGGQRKLWHVTERGAALAHSTGELSAPPKVLGVAEASGALQAHTLAVNHAGLAFLRAARERGDEFGPLSWRHEVAHPLIRGRGRRRRQLIADALLTYLVVDRERLLLEYRLLELDRSTLSLDRLASKLGRYAELYRAADDRDEPRWRNWYATFPAILVVLAGPDRDALERRRRTALALCRSDPELARTPEVSITVCLLAELERRGPFAPIWRAPDDPERAVDWLGRACGATSGRDGARR